MEGNANMYQINENVQNNTDYNDQFSQLVSETIGQEYLITADNDYGGQDNQSPIIQQEPIIWLEDKHLYALTNQYQQVQINQNQTTSQWVQQQMGIQYNDISEQDLIIPNEREDNSTSTERSLIIDQGQEESNNDQSMIQTHQDLTDIKSIKNKKDTMVTKIEINKEIPEGKQTEPQGKYISTQEEDIYTYLAEPNNTTQGMSKQPKKKKEKVQTIQIRKRYRRIHQPVELKPIPEYIRNYKRPRGIVKKKREQEYIKGIELYHKNQQREWQRTHMQFCREILKEEVLIPTQIMPPHKKKPQTYEYLHTYQKRTSIISPTRTGSHYRRSAKGEVKGPQQRVHKYHKVLPFYEAEKSYATESKLLDYVPLSAYREPMQPLIIPAITYRPGRPDRAAPTLLMDETAGHINIQNNVPNFYPLLPTRYCKHDDFLLIHVNYEIHPFMGRPLTTCDQMNHQNRRVIGSPLYIEAAKTESMWIEHVDQTMIYGHYVHKITDFTNITGLHIGTPCYSTCGTTHPGPSKPWYMHIDGVYHGRFIRQTVPFKSKKAVNIPDPTKDHPTSYRTETKARLYNSLFIKPPDVLDVLQQQRRK